MVGRRPFRPLRSLRLARRRGGAGGWPAGYRRLYVRRSAGCWMRPDAALRPRNRTWLGWAERDPMRPDALVAVVCRRMLTNVRQVSAGRRWAAGAPDLEQLVASDEPRSVRGAEHPHHVRQAATRRSGAIVRLAFTGRAMVRNGGTAPGQPPGALPTTTAVRPVPCGTARRPGAPSAAPPLSGCPPRAPRPASPARRPPRRPVSSAHPVGRAAGQPRSASPRPRPLHAADWRAGRSASAVGSGCSRRARRSSVPNQTQYSAVPTV